MVNGDSGTPKTTPAPWVSYTRAGCDVGNVSVANTVLENNTITAGGDIAVRLRQSLAGGRGAGRRCAPPTSSASPCIAPSNAGSVCGNQTSRTPRSDPLPDEPGGYNGFQRPVRRQVRRPGHHRRQRVR